MDLGTLLGIVFALAGILIGLAMEGGSILQILQPTAAMIVFGGTLGATMISFPMSVFKQAVAELFQVMQQLDYIDDVVIGLAFAFVAKIYGVASSNIFFLPAVGKLKFKHRKIMIVKEMMLEGTLGILEGHNPRLIEDRLTSFLDEEYKKLREREAALKSRKKAA